MGIKYRADIDGLRAVAVLSITIFHLRTAIFTGGYVGVDIFYVISGYLIGGNIFRQLDAGNFSLLDFYQRRFRRIIPALVAMLVGVSAVALLILYPPQLVDYAESMIAAALSVSNFHFWLNTNYFAPGAYEQPLLHTWSLGVEEQFYLLFPALALLLARWPRARMAPGLAIVAAASLALSVAGVWLLPSATFYLLPTRAWELLLGALVACTGTSLLDGRRVREAAALLGAALIAVPTLFYVEDTPFPGLAAIPPCLGTALLIATGRSGPTLVNRALALKPVVFIGLISYSLYLWHWPVIVLMQQAIPAPNLDKVGKAVAFVLSIGLGTASWYFVERPFRNPGVTARTIFRATGIGVAGVTAVGLAMLATGGVPQRFSPQVAATTAHLGFDRAIYREGKCQLETRAAIADYDTAACLAWSDTRPNILVLGDSHAAHLWWGVQQRFPHANVMQATASGCKPMLEHGPRDSPACVALIDRTLRSLTPERRPHLLIIAANWTLADAAPLRRTLTALRERAPMVAVAGPMVKYDTSLPKLLGLALDRRDPGLVARHRIVDPALEKAIFGATAGTGAFYLSLHDRLCSDGGCVTADAAGVPIQWDTSHLTAEGSLLVAEAFAPLVPRPR